MAGLRKNSDNRRPRKGSAPTGAVAKAAKPAGVPKNRSPTRTTRAVANQTTSTSTNQPAPANQPAPTTNQPASTNQPAPTNQAPASAPQRRGTLTADVLAHPSGFGYADPEEILRQAARDARRAANANNNRPRRPPAKKAAGKKKPTKGSGRARSAAAAAAAAPVVPAAVAQPPQPAPAPTQQSPPNGVETEGDGEPADNQPANDEPADIEPAPADNTAASDLAPEQDAQREAAEVQAAILEASATKEREDKDRVAKEEAAKKKRAAAKEKREAAEKEAREQAERDEAARITQEEADRKQAEEAEKKARAKAAREREEEAARQQKAAEKEAAKKEAAEKEAAAKKEAAKLKAAQEQAERDEAARKQAEDEARAKAAREEATQQQKIAEEAARQKAAQQQADQEKSAAQAKAAQAKEQAAKTKAAQDEAAKIKAAAQKKAADNVAAFKKAEEEAKVEKLRQAKEQKDKEEAELLAKEARGLKRPGAKRAAPPLDNQANKKAKTDDCKPSCARFEEDLNFAKFKFGKNPLRSPDGPVKFGAHVSLDIIFQALGSVTEAVNDTCVKEKHAKLWGIFHPRSLVDFNIVDHPIVLQRHDALVPINRSVGKKTYFSLVALVQTQSASLHEKDLFAMHHYDCDPSLRAAFDNTFAKKMARSQILSAGWAGSGKGDIEAPLGKSENRECCDRLPGPENEWTTGIHAILNGWVCALALKHNKNALLSKEGFYENAVDLINLAIRGHVRSRMILDFFDCYEYVLKDDLPEDARRRRTFTETKDFETYARLDKHILSLLGMKPAVDVDEVTGSTIKRTEAKETPLGSGRRTGDYAPSNLDAFMRGTDGPVGLPEEEVDAVKPEQAPVNDDGYDSARSEDDDDDVGDEDEDCEGKAVVDDKDKVVEEPKELLDFRGKVITPESRAAAAAARAAAKETLEREKREREEREAAAATAAARAKSAEAEDTTNSLFGDDDDKDMNDFYNNDAPPPTSAPQDDPEEDLYSSSRSPRRQPQSQPALQPTAVDDEEDLNGVSPPRNQIPPPTAPAPVSNLHLLGAPPPTPHDPYVVNGSPFLFPTMYDQPPPPPVTKSSSNLSSGKSTNGLHLPPPVPEPTSGRTPGFRVPSLSLSPEAKLKTPSNLSPGKTTNGLALPPPAPTIGRNPRFRVPSISLSPEGHSKTPSNPVPVAENVEAPAQRRPIVNPNPHGTFEVPDTSASSSEGQDDNADAAGEQDGTAYPTAAQQTTATQTADTPRRAAQTNAPNPTKFTTTTQPTAPHPTAPDIDTEEAWATANAGWLNRQPVSPGLDAAMAEYDNDNDDETPGPEATEYGVDAWRDGQNEYHMEVQALQTGDYDPESDDGFEVRQIVGDDVRYGDVEVEEGEDEYEIDYDYDV